MEQNAYMLEVSAVQIAAIVRGLDVFVRLGRGQVECVLEYLPPRNPEWRTRRAMQEQLLEGMLAHAKLLITGLDAGASHELTSDKVSDDVRVAYTLIQDLEKVGVVLEGRRYALRLSTLQMQVLRVGLDPFMRLGLGQLEQVIEWVPKCDIDWFRHRIDIERDLAIVKMIVTSFSANASYGIGNREVKGEVTVAYDIIQVVRRQLADDYPPSTWTVDQKDPLQFSPTEPLAPIRKV